MMRFWRRLGWLLEGILEEFWLQVGAKLGPKAIKKRCRKRDAILDGILKALEGSWMVFGGNMKKTKYEVDWKKRVAWGRRGV